ncbi:MAG: hypothetical protein HRU41_36070 [Saprospiraceae bacterium]|nr:hypothetical protein [Saprospiraceae bacterium]
MKINPYLIGLMALLWSCNTPAGEQKVSKIPAVNMCAPRGLAVDALAEIEGTLPLFEGLGEYSFPITSDNDLAQRYFEQGFKLTVGFNHAEAVRSFRYAIKQDENCAMCHWGLAYALGPNYNAGMEPEVVTVAYTAIQNALKLKDGLTEREVAFIDAMAERYGMAPTDDRSAYDQAYTAAMRKVHQQYPADQEAATLLAEAIMDMHPWDLWEKSGAPKPWTPEILSLLEGVLKENPDHPIAIHLYIHATEASLEPEKALPYVERLPAVTPGAGHLVHMPSHTYIRTGHYYKGMQANELAIIVDSNYMTNCYAAGIYPLAYFPHNYHFLTACAGFAGNAKSSIGAAYRMVHQLDTNIMRQEGFTTIQHFWSIPMFVQVKFTKWDDILATPKPAADLRYPTAIWRYARGMAFTGKGDIERAKSEWEALQEFVNDTALDEATIWDINNMGVLIDIADQVLAAEIAVSEGQLDQAISLFEKAIALEDSLNYNEPPDWFFSVRHHLGSILLKAEKYAAAEATYRKDLEIFPETGWALHGLYQSLEKQGKTTEAKAVQTRFQAAWAHADTQLDGSTAL